jgi:hypothetical protein
MTEEKPAMIGPRGETFTTYADAEKALPGDACTYYALAVKAKAGHALVRVLDRDQVGFEGYEGELPFLYPGEAQALAISLMAAVELILDSDPNDLPSAE